MIPAGSKDRWDLSRADPFGADPFGADPFGADPFGADPFGADPFGADPFGADPFGANCNSPVSIWISDPIFPGLPASPSRIKSLIFFIVAIL